MTIDGFPILDRLLAQGCALRRDTGLEKNGAAWISITEYEFKELSGSID